MFRLNTKRHLIYRFPRLQINNNMADDLDIEAMLEAPYKKVGVYASK